MKDCTWNTAGSNTKKILPLDYIHSPLECGKIHSDIRLPNSFWPFKIFVILSLFKICFIHIYAQDTVSHYYMICLWRCLPKCLCFQWKASNATYLYSKFISLKPTIHLQIEKICLPSWKHLISITKTSEYEHEHYYLRRFPYKVIRPRTKTILISQQYKNSKT
jgi:hypothetical protein